MRSFWHIDICSRRFSAIYHDSPQCPIFYSYLTYILTYNLRFYRAYVLTFILASMQYFIWHAMIWNFIWQYLTMFGICSDIVNLAFYLAFYLWCLSPARSRTSWQRNRRWHADPPLSPFDQLRGSVRMDSNGPIRSLHRKAPLTFSLQGLQGFQPIPTLEGAVPLHKRQLLSQLGREITWSSSHRTILHPNRTPPRAGLTGR